jgi:hypothetical protein
VDRGSVGGTESEAMASRAGRAAAHLLGDGGRARRIYEAAAPGVGLRGGGAGLAGTGGDDEAAGRWDARRRVDTRARRESFSLHCRRRQCCSVAEDATKLRWGED